MGDVDETRDVQVGRNLGDGLSNLDVDVVIRVVPSLVIPSDQVVHNISMLDTLCCLLRDPSIPFKRDNLSQITTWPQSPFFVLITVRHNDLSSLPGEFLNEIPGEETGRTEDGDGASRV